MGDNSKCSAPALSQFPQRPSPKLNAKLTARGQRSTYILYRYSPAPAAFPLHPSSIFLSFAAITTWSSMFPWLLVRLGKRRGAVGKGVDTPTHNYIIEGRKPPAWQTGAPDVTTSSRSLYHGAGCTVKVAAEGQLRHRTALSINISCTSSCNPGQPQNLHPPCCYLQH